MKLHHLIIGLCVMALALGCSSGDEPSDGSAIALSAEADFAHSKGSVPAGMCDNFKVYAALEMGGTVQDVMKGYNVRFVDDDWIYVIEGQHLVYWNGSADRYMFTAGAPIDSVKSITATSMTLYMENNTRGSVLAATPLEVKSGSAAFGRPLTLNFNYVHSRISVAFVNSSSTETVITGIKLTPTEPIASEANMTYSYDWSGATPVATSLLRVTAYSDASLAFSDVTIPAGVADAVLSATRYYCIPCGTNPTGWSVEITSNSESKSATFVNDKVWEPGKSYMYIFSLSEIVPKLMNVISYDDPAFDCNNIVPGGTFSNGDMTD